MLCVPLDYKSEPRADASDAIFTTFHHFASLLTDIQNIRTFIYLLQLLLLKERK